MGEFDEFCGMELQNDYFLDAVPYTIFGSSQVSSLVHACRSDTALRFLDYHRV